VKVHFFAGFLHLLIIKFYGEASAHIFHSSTY